MNERFCDVRRVAELLGCSVSTVWRNAANGTLPKPIKIGGLTRWSAQELEQAIARAMAKRDAV